MLTELSIKNFAIIDDLRIRFSGGFTVITGETGAGKSILVNAVNLLLGSRATPGMVRTGAASAELEALFSLEPGTNFCQSLEEMGHDCQDGLLIQRTISDKDRHRIYINGRIATMQMLSQVTEKLASISGQHAHQRLLKEDEHLNLLDHFAGLWPLRQEVAGLHARITALGRELSQARALVQSAGQRRELLEFQAREIESAAILPNEDVDLEQEKMRLKNARLLAQTGHECLEELSLGENSVVSRLGVAAKKLDAAAAKDPALAPQVQSVREALYQAEDAASELGAYLGRLHEDQGRLEAVEERLYFLSVLKRKYGGTLESIAERAKAIKQELSGLETQSGSVENLEAEQAALAQAIREKAQSLSRQRAQAAGAFSEAVAAQLQGLGMAGTRFSVNLFPLPLPQDLQSPLAVGNAGVDATGMDHAVFLIAPNVGESLKPLKETASGGELSRVVLALKAILAGTDCVETVIFDEVDAGIGGAVAHSVGEKLFSLAKTHQVVCITHLPQIARFADQHFRIEKKVVQGRTISSVLPLEGENRVEEIARMLGGGPVTPTSRKHAAELLGL